MATALVVFMLALVAVSKARETLLLSPLSFRPAELTDDTIVKRSASYFSGCDVNSIVSKIQQCGVIMTQSTMTPYGLENFCEKAECSLHCLDQALGSCYKEDALFAWEPAPTRVVLRGQCANQTATLSFYKNCLMGERSRSCVLDFYQSYMSIFKQKWMEGEYSTFRSQYCSTIKSLHECVDFESCNPAEAQVGKVFLDGTLFSKCGSSQSDYLFQKFGSSPKC